MVQTCASMHHLKAQKDRFLTVGDRNISERDQTDPSDYANYHVVTDNGEFQVVPVGIPISVSVTISCGYCQALPFGEVVTVRIGIQRESKRVDVKRDFERVLKGESRKRKERGR